MEVGSVLASLATQSAGSTIGAAKQALDRDAFTQELPQINGSLDGGADLASLRGMTFDSGTTYQEQFRNNPFSGMTGMTLSVLNHLKSKRAEQDFEAQKADRYRQALNMNSIRDYRNYQRRGMAESAYGQMNDWVGGMANLY